MPRPVKPARRALTPRISFARWGGADADGLHDYQGGSLSIEWLRLIVEFNFGKAQAGREWRDM